MQMVILQDALWSWVYQCFFFAKLWDTYQLLFGKLRAYGCKCPSWHNLRYDWVQSGAKWCKVVQSGAKTYQIIQWWGWNSNDIVCCSKAQDVDRVFCQCTKGTVEIIQFPWVKLEALPIWDHFNQLSDWDEIVETHGAGSKCLYCFFPLSKLMIWIDLISIYIEFLWLCNNHRIQWLTIPFHTFLNGQSGWSHDDPYAGGRSNTTRTARLASQRKGARNLRKATSPCLEKWVRDIRIIPGMVGMFFFITDGDNLR